MSHEIDTMMYAGEKPWHGLGTEVPNDDVYDIEKCIVHSGCGWDAIKVPLFVRKTEKVTVEDTGEVNVAERFDKIDCRYGMVRSDNGTFLGTVGPRYTPLQNAKAFDFFQPFLESKAASLHTAGSLDEGRKVWVLAKLALDNAEIVKGDEVAKFILLSNSHDGTMAVRVGFTPIRVVCMNTLRMAHSDDASKLIRIRHHKSVEKTLEDVRKTMNLANQEFEATAEQYRFLASRNVVSQADLMKYMKIVLKVEDEDKEKISTRTLNVIEDILNRFDGKGIGSNIPGVSGTWWGAYNAVTEYLSYNRGHNADTRLNSLWFGDSANMNSRALETAIELAEAA